MIEFLSALPLWLLAAVLNLWLMGFAAVSLWVVRRHVLERLQLTYNDAFFAAAVAQSAMVLYGMVAALTAVSVWQKHSEVSNIVSGEAAAITTLWRDVGGYPSPLREQARQTLLDYTEQVIQGAWPLQRQGQIPSQGVDFMNRLQSQMYSFEPASESESLIHAEALGAFNHLVQQRRERIDSVHAKAPTVLWWVLLPGAMGCLAMFLFFHVDNAPFQTVLLLGLAGFLALVLFVIIALDRPYSGALGISADPYQVVIDQHMK
jgi:hypothetical protein